ncbi:MAG TPA: winged helix-turn-helix domain-containing protein [Ilumatobacteraceae bacterium]|jgi:DNA-binding transcriptional ArsR family regulator|nr:winged helix-turn-helix domain-containing protein [Ilumatobacteraceae bacterium]
MADNERMTITDVRVLAALAHPARLAILHLLLTVGDATATQCSAVVGESPSSCSYHLRHLEKFGLVERVESDTDDEVDGRTRRWRSVATGFDFGEPHSTGSPELVAVSAALITTGLEENVRLARHYLTHLDTVPEAWQDVAAFSTYALMVTADELRAVTEAIDAIVRPLRGAARPDAPVDARPVRLSLEAFPRTDLP